MEKKSRLFSIPLVCIPAPSRDPAAPPGLRFVPGFGSPGKLPGLILSGPGAPSPCPYRGRGLPGRPCALHSARRLRWYRGVAAGGTRVYEYLLTAIKQSGLLRPGLNGGDPCELLWSSVDTRQGSRVAVLFFSSTSDRSRHFSVPRRSPAGGR